MRKRWEGFWARSCPLRQRKGIFCWPRLRKGANKTDNPKPKNTRERRRKGRRERPGSRESKGGTFLEFIGFGFCQSSHFLLGCGKKHRGEGRREGEREVPSDSSLSLSFSLCFFTKNTELGLKLKQGKTRKSSAVQSLALLHSHSFLFKEAIL